MRDYEVVFIIDDRQLDVSLEKFTEQVVARVEEMGGKVQSKTSLGRRQFARAVKKQQAGTYLDFVLSMEPQQVDEFIESYRLSDEVLRVKVFLYEGKPRAATVMSAEEAAPSDVLEP